MWVNVCKCVWSVCVCLSLEHALHMWMCQPCHLEVLATLSMPGILPASSYTDYGLITSSVCVATVRCVEEIICCPLKVCCKLITVVGAALLDAAFSVGGKSWVLGVPCCVKHQVGSTMATARAAIVRFTWPWNTNNCWPHSKHFTCPWC